MTDHTDRYRVTYCMGMIRTRFTSDLTKRDFVSLATDLGDAFTAVFNGRTIVDNQYLFEPEPISDGGLVIRACPGWSHGMYKSLRLGFIQWPRVPADVMTTWEGDDTVVIVRGTKSGIGLKAFYRAPLWSQEELMVVKQVLARYGVLMTGMPSKNQLSQWSGEGT